MRVIYRINKFRDIDTIAFDEYLNEMYQEGWILENTRSYFVLRFRETQDIQGYLHCARLSLSNKEEIEKKQEDFCFEKVRDNLFVTNSFDNLEKYQSWELEQYSEKNTMWLLALVVLCGAWFLLFQISMKHFENLNLFTILNGNGDFDLLFLLPICFYGILNIIRNKLYINEIRRCVLSGETISRAKGVMFDRIVYYLMIFIITIYTLISFITFYPINFNLLVGIGALIIIVCLIFLITEEIAIKIFKVVLTGILILGVQGAFKEAIVMEYKDLCIGKEACSILETPVSNLFYKRSVIGVYSGVYLDYFEARYDFTRELAKDYYVKKYSLVKLEDSVLDTDEVYTNGKTMRLYVRGQQVIFVVSNEEEGSSEAIDFYIDRLVEKNQR